MDDASSIGMKNYPQREREKERGLGTEKLLRCLLRGRMDDAPWLEDEASQGGFVLGTYSERGHLYTSVWS